MKGACNGSFFPAPGALGRNQKVKYLLISITKSISNFLDTNFVFVRTNERYKTEYRIQDGILIFRLSHVPGVGLWGAGGSKGGLFFQTWSCGISNRRG